MSVIKLADRCFFRICRWIFPFFGNQLQRLNDTHHNTKKRSRNISETLFCFISARRRGKIYRRIGSPIGES